MRKTEKNRVKDDKRRRTEEKTRKEIKVQSLVATETVALCIRRGWSRLGVGLNGWFLADDNPIFSS
jgi:hypothetical protein